MNTYISHVYLCILCAYCKYFLASGEYICARVVIALAATATDFFLLRSHCYRGRRFSCSYVFVYDICMWNDIIIV